MRIKWSNIVALMFVIIAILIFVKHGENIAAFCGSMKHLAQSDSTLQERTEGLLAFGFVAICLLAGLKITLNSRELNEGNRPRDNQSRR